MIQKLAIVALAVVFLPSCSSSPDGEQAGSGVPDWYIVKFNVTYQDGRTYQGQCTWPDSFNAGLQYDIKGKESMVQPGKTVTANYTVVPPQSKHYIPHGLGTMTFPDGTQQTGYWQDGEYTGTNPP